MGTLRLHYEEKNILRPIGAFFLLKLKVTKIPIQNRLVASTGGVLDVSPGCVLVVLTVATFSPAFWFVSSDSLRFGGSVDVTMLRWLVGARVDCSRGLRARSVACNPRCRQ